MNDLYKDRKDEVCDLNDEDEIDLEEAIEEYKNNPGDDSKF